MNRLVIVAYAINGRGMGHLVRQLSILRWVRRLTAVLDIKAECWVLTSSEADTLARREGFASLKMPSKAMMRDAGLEPARYLAVARTWVLNTIAGLSPDLLLVDTFPGGSFGELVAALELAKHRVLVAREVKQQLAEEAAYQALLPLYERHIIPHEVGTGPILIREREELLPREEARRALGIAGDRRAVYLTLGGGGDAMASATLPALVDPLRARGFHVVVGAGPLYEGIERRGEGITWMDRYVPLELFTGLDAAISAGGYNSFHELMFAGVPTVFLPQPRIADDQAARCRAAEAAGAARVATWIEEVIDLLEAPGDPKKARALVAENGARSAAIAALETVIPARDLATASSVLTPALLSTFSNDRSFAAAELLRIFGGGTPRELNQRRAVLAELTEAGHVVPKSLGAAASSGPPGLRIERFLQLTRDAALPMDTALSLIRTLRKKFPGASGELLIECAERLFKTWARFSDWMGAVSFLRAVPVQRELTLDAFTDSVEAWLMRETDLFDAHREFARLEGGGRRSVAEVLSALRAEGERSRELYS